MASLWYKLKNANIRKRHTLHSLSAGFVFFIFLFVFTKIFSVSLCPVKNLFDISCFGCGMTRGFISILNLNFKTAYEYNVLSIPLFIGIVLYFILSLIDICFDKNYILVIEKQLSKRYMFLIYIVILLIATFLNNTK